MNVSLTQGLMLASYGGEKLIGLSQSFGQLAWRSQIIKKQNSPLGVRRVAFVSTSNMQT